MLASFKRVLVMVAVGISLCAEAKADVITNATVISRGVVLTHDWTIQIGSNFSHRIGLMGYRNGSGQADTGVCFGLGSFIAPLHFYSAVAIVCTILLAVVGFCFYGRSHRCHKAV